MKKITMPETVSLPDSLDSLIDDQGRLLVTLGDDERAYLLALLYPYTLNADEIDGFPIELAQAFEEIKYSSEYRRETAKNSGFDALAVNKVYEPYWLAYGLKYWPVDTSGGAPCLIENPVYEPEHGALIDCGRVWNNPGYADADSSAGIDTLAKTGRCLWSPATKESILRTIPSAVTPEPDAAPNAPAPHLPPVIHSTNADRSPFIAGRFDDKTGPDHWFATETEAVEFAETTTHPDDDGESNEVDTIWGVWDEGRDVTIRALILNGFLYPLAAKYR